MRIEVMSRRGHEILAEWHPDSAHDELQSIGQQFDELLRKGYSAFGSGSGTRLRTFDPTLTEDVVFVAPVTGG